MNLDNAKIFIIEETFSVSNLINRIEQETGIVLDDINKPISEQGGWHTKPPQKDGCYLVEATNIPYKNSEFLVAEYDTNTQCWYDEAFENPIEITRWKKI